MDIVNMNGFIYFIGWPGLNTWYVGQRYANGCKPSDLWDTYFTSSAAVLKFSLHNGKPDIIHILEENISRTEIDSKEQLYIKKFKAIENIQFLNHPHNIINKDFNTVGLAVKPSSKPSRRIGPNDSRRKLSISQLTEIKQSKETGVSLATRFNVSTALISKIRNKK